MSLGAGHRPAHTLFPIMWVSTLQGCQAQPHSHPVPPITWASRFGGTGHSPAHVLPPVTTASPSRRLDGSRTRWLLLGCILLESEGPPSA